MTAKGVGRGGRREVPRASLAARPRRGGKTTGRYARPEAPVEEYEEQKPRKVRREMRELMADWRPAERAAAQKVVDFFETKLRHYEGKHAGKPFLLELWQESIIRRLFGRLRADGSRVYRTAYIEIPRKNGKSTLAAGIALYLLAEDDEAGAQVFSAAGDRAQARIVFRAAEQMLAKSPALKLKLTAFRNQIESPDGFYRVLSADADTAHGLNVHGAVVDELHTQPSRDLWDVLTTGTGAREQPLCVAITTAGYDRHSICWELHEYARKILEASIVDESFLAVIYGADVDDDWTSEATWHKANPNLGVSVKLDYLKAECEKAKASAAYENTFRRLHLDQWTTQENRFLPMQRWDECAGLVDVVSLRGRPCYGGLDLSSTLDVTAFVLVFPDGRGCFDVVPYFFLPAANIDARSKRDGVPYNLWAKQGLITLTDGECIDYATVREHVIRCHREFGLREVAYDRWGAEQMSQELTASGVTVLQFGQGTSSMSNPTKDLLAKVVSGKLRHGGHPVLRWMAECTSVIQAAGDLVKPVKPDRGANTSRIDGIVALIMALARATLHDASEMSALGNRSTYETEGVWTL